LERKGLEAVLPKDSRILILGTLPGIRSLERGEYYAQPRNNFWRIMGEIFKFSPDLPYSNRINRLKENGIALWDVCASAYRTGSLDSKIKISTAVPNDFEKLFATHRHIKMVCFNGSLAEKLYRRKVLFNLGELYQQIRLETLPSTSPANTTLSNAEKKSRWRSVLTTENQPLD
jgi:TDG/mug DNA glycosylase family protein